MKVGVSSCISIGVWVYSLHKLQVELSELQSRPRLGLLDLIREPWMRWPLLISIGLHMSQQLSGINGVWEYLLMCVLNSLPTYIPLSLLFNSVQ